MAPRKGFWRCTNCGGTPSWANITRTARVHSDLHALAFAGNRLIVGTDGGVWSTTNSGQSWQNHNNGLSTAMFYSAALHPTDRQFMIGGLRDFQASVAGPSNRWSILQQVASWEWGEAEVAMSSSQPSTHWMLAWIFGAISRTTDGGKTGIQADVGIDKAGAAFVAPVRKCPADDEVFLTGTNRLWRTNNFFSASPPSWAQNSPTHPFPFPNSLDAPGTIHSIAFPPSEAWLQHLRLREPRRGRLSDAQRRRHVDRSGSDGNITGAADQQHRVSPFDGSDGLRRHFEFQRCDPNQAWTRVQDGERARRDAHVG